MRRFWIVCLSMVMVVLLCPIRVPAQENVQLTPPEHKMLASGNGRYMFGQISQYRRDTYMLDTKTGRLWQIVADKKDSTALQPVPYIHILGNYSYLPDTDQASEIERKLSDAMAEKRIHSSESTLPPPPKKGFAFKPTQKAKPKTKK